MFRIGHAEFAIGTTENTDRCRPNRAAVDHRDATSKGIQSAADSETVEGVRCK